MKGVTSGIIVIAVATTCMLVLAVNAMAQGNNIDITPPVTSASPAGRVYGTNQSVTLSCSDATGSGCATTYYCLGSNCTPATPYNGPIAITVPTDLRFFSTDNAGNSEVIRTATYTFDTTPPTTVSYPGAGTYEGIRNVTLTCFDAQSSCSATYYCLGTGCTPTTPYSSSAGINISATTELRYFSVDRFGNTEAAKTENYTITPDTTPPVTTPDHPGGSYGLIDVYLNCNDGSGSGCAATYYCLGVGCSPTTTYDGIIIIATPTDLRFYSIDKTSNSEAVKTVSYQVAYPVIAVTPASADFGSVILNDTVTRIVNLSNAGTAPLVISSPISLLANGYSIAPGGPAPCDSLTPTIPVGVSCSLAVTFTPGTIGPFGGFYNINSNAGNSLYSSVTGNGILTDTVQSHWTANGPYGGNIYSMAIDPKQPATLYVGISAGIFKSINSGVSWASVYTGGSIILSDINGVRQTISDSANALAIDPISTSIIYAGLSSGIIKSTDGGLSWNPVNPSAGYINALVVEPTVPSTVYAARDSGGILKTVDGGVTWVPCNNGLTASTVYTLAIDPKTANTIYAGTPFGIFKSSDGGGNWSQVNAGLSSTIVYSLAIDPVNTAIIYAGTFDSGVIKSVDGGGSWNGVNNGIANPMVTSLTVDPMTPSTVFAGTFNQRTTDSGIYKSTDSGSTWNQVYTSMLNDVVRGLVIDPISTANVFATTSMYNFNESPLGVVRSSDGGVTWKEFNRGLRPDEVGVMAMDPTNPDKLYAASATGLARNNGATTLGLFRSTDRGNNWQTNTSLAVVGNIAALAINPVTPSTMYAGLYAGIFKSIDGGSSWSKLNLGANITAIAIDPATPATLYVGSYGGPFKSTDGGDSWNQINIGLPDSTVLSLAIDPVTPGTLYAGTYYGIYKSTNGGGNWSLINTGLTSSGVSKLVIDPVTPATVYAVTVGAYDGSEAPAVLKSTDRGTTWSRLVTGMLSSISDFAVDPVSPTTLYMAGYGGLVKSIDGGKSWGQLTGGATIISAYSVIIDPTHPATLYVGTNSGLYIVAQGTDVMVTPSSIDFGSTLPNNPVSRIITIKNSGIGPLVVSPSSSLVNRDESALFSVTPGGVNPCASLTPTLPEGGSCTLLVSFTPISTGAKSATFHIMTNAEGRAVVDLPLTGTGASSSYNLMLTVAGDGRGSVASTPTGIACNTNCSAIFDFNTLVNLHAKPADYSIFGGWSGGICTGSADCQVTITADVPVTAMFSKDTVHPVMIDGPTPVFYPSLQNACFAAVSGDTIKAWGTEFSGDILLGTAITIKGGFNSGYTANVGETTLHGLLTISIGQLTVEYLVVR